MPELARAPGPVYLTIANALAGAIGRGELQPGERLPPHRALASALGVDLTTVTRGYAEAQRRGLLESATGRGTYVRRDLSAGARTGVVDMSMNLPPLPAEPDLREALRDGIARLLRHEDLATLMAYRTGAGTVQDRAAAAAWLAPNFLGDVSPGRVLVCPGAQCAVHAVLSTLAHPGDAVVTEMLAYPGLRAVATQLGLTLLGAPVDEQGLVPDALDAICRDRRPRAIYCTPTIQNPTTATMTPGRRTAIAEVVQRHGVALIEDDAYGLLPETPPPAIATLVPAQSYYVATTAKCLSPGLRTAFLVVPPGQHAQRVTQALRAVMMMASPLLLGLVTLWIREGTALAIRDGIRREARARQAIARAILPDGLYAADPEGLHVWLRLPPHWGQAEFVAYVRDRGLALVPSDAFHLTGRAPHAVRIALGAAPDHERLREALVSITESLQQPMPAFFADVV
jgi:DNA-binding transcriptional MocR family regulator